MARVARIDLSGRDPRLDDTAIQVACDVDNPFHGPRGAARVFGPQKGAAPGGRGAPRRGPGASWPRAVPRATGIDLQALPGRRRGGRRRRAAWRRCSAPSSPRARPWCSTRVGLAERLEGAALCITGEGRLDETSRAGKAPGRGGRRLRATPASRASPCAARWPSARAPCGRTGFAAAFAVGRGVRPLDEALAATEADLAAGRRGRRGRCGPASRPEAPPPWRS